MGEEGPGQDLSHLLLQPLDPQQVQNVWDAIVRIALLSSLMRFLMELGQQVATMMVTNTPNGTDDAENFMTMQVRIRIAPGVKTPANMSPMHEDEVALVQTEIQQKKATILYGALQQSLETNKQHRRQRAGLLHDMFKAQTSLVQNPDVERVLAMLVVFRDEAGDDAHERVTEDDKDWARAWWTSLLTLPTLSNSGATSSYTAGRERAVGLDGV